ncbi:MAG TPA: phosphoenolpyruvate--protein phosphotransferase [Cyanothece sp. UBA12306]|nr:phosphoenolpyruvate--protein phosphotransferase [Cyanothece sp. UBA12306]
MISLVLVSHSLPLAESLVTLIQSMTKDSIKIAIAAGIDDPEYPLGTDVIKIKQAIESVYSDDGVLILMDLGSAVISAEMAVEFFDTEQQNRIKLSAAPLVEGAISAAIMASTGASIEVVIKEAQESLKAKLSQLQINDILPNIQESKSSIETPISRIVKVNIVNGLHIRPAAKFVQKANQFTAKIRVKKCNNFSNFINGKSLNQLMLLGIKQGEQIEIETLGEDSVLALNTLQELIEQDLLETETSAKLLNSVTKTQKIFINSDKLQGIPASPGTVIAPGKIYETLLPKITKKISDNPETEWQKLHQVIQNAKQEIENLAKTISTNNDIFEAHLLYLDDPELLTQIKRLIFEKQYTASFAWKTVIDQTITDYQNLENEYLQARVIDLLDLRNRILKILLGGEINSLILEIPSIIIASQLVPSQVAQFNPSQVLGIATVFGSATDHSAIIANLLGIPMVVGLGENLLKLNSNIPLKIDGTNGIIHINPPLEAKVIEPSQLSISLKPAITQDGYKIPLLANIIGIADAQLAMNYGAEGVGLLRTEFLYLDRLTPPTEEEQIEFYQAIANIVKPHPLTIRTADIGGDKFVPYLNLEQEANPFLGKRGIRQSLAETEVFKTQLKAILKVSSEANIRLMLPMVSCLNEIKMVKKLLEEVKQELQQKNITFDQKLPLGIMIEVPSAAIMADKLASEVDFFSIGTNDLTQYLMAADRTNSQVVDLTNGFPPALLRIIAQCVTMAHEKGIKVSVCGQLASSPDAIAILLGLGIDELSINPPMICQISEIITQISLEKVKQSLAI